ncbi:MAG TPA: endo alpha-1,4 polygalactosaminidase [Acidimicrobiales bacterium]|nr:endo alpha-1,4 polygalactosaminidase [Acidimicrobiales bacterium]
MTGKRPRFATLTGIFVLAGALTSIAAPPASATSWWRPHQLTSWAYVIGENYPLTVPPVVNGVPTRVQAVDADLGDQDGLTADGAPVADPSIESSVAAIHAYGGHAICYVDAGTAENWRSDYPKFDPSELGGPVPGWAGEQFINVADWSARVPAPYETLREIMTNRITLCKEEGFDAVEADNVDAYNDGKIGDFTLTMGREETYLRELIRVVHTAGLAFFLKNEVNGDSLISSIEPLVDGEIDEQCWQYSECSALEPFIRADKPVLNVEYAPGETQAEICPSARAFPMATIYAGLDLTGPIEWGCWQYASRAPRHAGH